MTDTNLLLADETFAIRGACFEVYKTKGTGFTEAVYQECLEIELGLRGIPFESQARLALEYKGRPLLTTLQPDFVCHAAVVVEIKAARELTDDHRAQLHNYLRATGLRVGLLVNFGHHPGVQIERIVR